MEEEAESRAISPWSGGESKRGSFIILTPKKLLDSISLRMRYRDYNYVKIKCQYLINAYPDSIQSFNAISKLYLATSASDTSIAGRTALKTFYEGLINSHGYNVSLVARCNYFIQKCKVLLHQYTSALQGFQQIINGNPYGYEGLIAKWDYMAVSLLMQGQGGGEGDELKIMNDELRIEDLSDYGSAVQAGDEYADNNKDGDQGPRDKSPWTKDDRKNIKQAINKSFESTRNAQDKRIQILTDKANNGNEDAKKQLQIVKTLKDIVKTHKPKNIIEHIKIVNSDIQKLIVAASNKKVNKPVNLIPTVFALHQNYPNPFNPTTTIKYDLPKDVKVVIKVYDILGRLVTTLINENQKAGYYQVQFNGNNLASGVYFYRIEAGDYKLSKKMVILK